MRGPALLAAALALATAGVAGGSGAEAGRGVEVAVFFPRGDPGPRCDRVYPRPRLVRPPAVLTGALRALLAGPTATERARGYGGWFSAKTAGMLRGVSLRGGVARIDFRDLRRVIPNASSSCGSALLLAQLERTATQFPTVRRAVYSLQGSISRFYEWLQRSPPSS